MSEMIAEETLARVQTRMKAVLEAIQSVYVGEQKVAELLAIALLARGHVLLEGIPGVAKTTLVKTFAATLGCSFRRIQFTPDLLPADITGTFVFSPGDGVFQLRKGPIFAHVVLGDEINRAPAKTQSALLEAMQEQQVTIEGDTRALPSPFLVLATQNPIEEAGTYPLPEAQIDRFLIRLVLGYPSARDERTILRRFLAPPATPEAVLTPEEIIELSSLVSRVHVEDELLDYVVRLARHTREHAQVYLGASPRASLALVKAARARALLSGRAFALPDDVKALAGPVWAHRLVLTPEAEMEERRAEEIIDRALAEVPTRGTAR
ncbi:MAG: MoxR family ATPase [Myxococcales bacterium]|nr:MoxR family ATPase [Myxococcales bacterium]